MKPRLKYETFVFSCLVVIPWVAATADDGASPPWPGQYKIKPSEKDRLTEADVVGPDGIVYPNWTRCGVQGGIPKVEVAAKIEDFGGRADDDKDDSVALDRACQSVGEKGGGAVLLGEGTYHLDLPVAVRHDGVVIRGRGPDKTRIIFRYGLPPGGIVFHGFKPGDRIGSNSHIILHARPTGLDTLTIEVDDQVVHQSKLWPNTGNDFATSIRGWKIVGRFPGGRHTLRGTARYQDGTSVHTEVPALFDSKFDDTRAVPDFQAALLFAGKGHIGPPVKLARDGCRGDRRLVLESPSNLAPGDCIHLTAPPTERWRDFVRIAYKWSGCYREYALQVEKVEGNTITVSQPLRIDFPVVDGSFVRKVTPIQRCGVEDLFLEQSENLWISSVLFDHAWNCWARGVKVKKCGRFPVYGTFAKWCEIRDCVFDDAWFKGNGGTAYVGWSRCWDCLMENVEAFKFRHGPLFQWAASGCVIRKGVFHESDGQWHGGWAHENLFEQCVVESSNKHGAYGCGMWGSPPEFQGPIGPRNVVYNCDVSSPSTGLWMGGMNENWLILHNRFRVERGNGVFAKTGSFDHFLRGNVFVLKDPKSSMIHLATSDCTGLGVVDNQLYGGNGQIVSGKAQPVVLERNQALPLGDAARPQPAVPSIYEWQRSRAAK